MVSCWTGIGVRLAAIACAVFACCAAPSAAATIPPALVGTPLSNASDLSGAIDVAVSGHYAYTPAAYLGQLTAIDISNPASLRDAGATGPALSLENGSNLTLANGYAFVTAKNRVTATSNDDGSGNALTIVDIHSDPAHPMVVGSYHDSTALFGAYGVALQGTYAFVAAQGILPGQPNKHTDPTGAFTVIDVSDPTHPTLVTSIANNALSGQFADALNHATSVAISGHYAYVTAFNPSRLTVIDIANPTSPQIVASIQNTAKLAYDADVAIQGNDAYITDQGGSGISVVDISNPLAPRIVSWLSNSVLSGAYRIRVRGPFAYVAADLGNSVGVIDVSDSAHPHLLATLTDATNLFSTTGLDLDPASKFILASSPTRSGSPLPPPGTISAIALDPAPLSVHINVTSKPPSPTSTASATFRMGANDAVAVTRCSLDHGAPAPCTTPGSETYSGLAPGTHTFTVVAVDPAGETASDRYTWRVVPVTRPTVSLASPRNGHAYALGEPLQARFFCTPGLGSTLSVCSGTLRSGARIDTGKAGRYTFSVTAKDTDGATRTVVSTYRVVAGPHIRGLRQTARVWRVTTPPRWARRLPLGTTFTFTLSERARVSLMFLEVVKGRVVANQCVAATHTNAHDPSCYRLAPRGTLIVAGHKGLNRVHFTGHLGSRRLGHGTYKLEVTASREGVSSGVYAIDFAIAG